jgi:hypothetical protein
MTKLAVPLRPDAAGPSEPHPDTPSKKHRRTDEIAASDGSSRYASLTPHRGSHTASEAGRPSKRLATAEENRRVSAPSRLENTSPVQANIPTRRRYEEHPSPTTFKEEKMVCCDSSLGMKRLTIPEFLTRLASLSIGRFTSQVSK